MHRPRRGGHDQRGPRRPDPRNRGQPAASDHAQLRPSRSTSAPTCSTRWPAATTSSRVRRTSGSSLRGALKGWYYHGVLPDTDWPALDTSPEPDLDRTPTVAAPAARHPLGAFYRVGTARLDDIQSAVAELSAVVVSAAIHDGWNHPVPLVRTVDGVEQRHAVIDRTTPRRPSAATRSASSATTTSASWSRTPGGPSGARGASPPCRTTTGSTPATTPGWRVPACRRWSPSAARRKILATCGRQPRRRAGARPAAARRPRRQPRQRRPALAHRPVHQRPGPARPHLRRGWPSVTGGGREAPRADRALRPRRPQQRAHRPRRRPAPAQLVAAQRDLPGHLRLADRSGRDHREPAQRPARPSAAGRGLVAQPHRGRGPAGWRTGCAPASAGSGRR